MSLVESRVAAQIDERMDVCKYLAYSFLRDRMMISTEYYSYYYA